MSFFGGSGKYQNFWEKFTVFKKLWKLKFVKLNFLNKKINFF